MAAPIRFGIPALLPRDTPVMPGDSVSQAENNRPHITHVPQPLKKKELLLAIYGPKDQSSNKHDNLLRSSYKNKGKYRIRIEDEYGIHRKDHRKDEYRTLFIPKENLNRLIATLPTLSKDKSVGKAIKTYLHPGALIGSAGKNRGATKLKETFDHILNQFELRNQYNQDKYWATDFSCDDPLSSFKQVEKDYDSLLAKAELADSWSLLFSVLKDTDNIKPERKQKCVMEFRKYFEVPDQGWSSDTQEKYRNNCQIFSWNPVEIWQRENAYPSYVQEEMAKIRCIYLSNPKHGEIYAQSPKTRLVQEFGTDSFANLVHALPALNEAASEAIGIIHELVPRMTYEQRDAVLKAMEDVKDNPKLLPGQSSHLEKFVAFLKAGQAIQANAVESANFREQIYAPLKDHFPSQHLT